MSDQTIILNEDEAERIIAAGEEIAAMVQSTAWRLVMNQLQRDAEAAMEQLAEVDAYDPVAVAHCQNRVFRFRWLEDTANELLQQAASVMAHDEVEGEGDAI